MNTVTNDKGETVLAVGAPGSLERVKVEWPSLICKMKNVYLAQPNAQAQMVLINKMLQKRRIVGVDRTSLIDAAWQAALMEKKA